MHNPTSSDVAAGHESVHESLAKLGLTSLPHECSVVACPGGYRWIGYTELLNAARYAVNTSQLPVEAQTMLAAAIFKVDSVAAAERGSSRPK